MSNYFHAIYGQGGAPAPDLSPVLLWTNSNPSAEFAAQTVSLDLTEYVGVIVEFITTAGTNALASRLYCKKTDTYGNLGAGFTNVNGYARNVLSVNNTGIEFGNALVGTSQTNNAVVPMKIYGVKEYVVDSNLNNISVGTITAGKTVNCNIGDLVVIFVTDTKEFNTLVKSGAESLQMSSNISAIGNYGYMEIVKATSEVVTLNSDYSYYSVISV